LEPANAVWGAATTTGERITTMTPAWVVRLTRTLERGGSRRAVLAAALAAAAGAGGWRPSGATPRPGWPWGLAGAACGGLAGIGCPDGEQCVIAPTGGGRCVAIGPTGADASDQGDACGATRCPAGEVCCNASCGFCAPPGVACIDLACVPAA
jgi:hypothetical protein